MNFAHHPIGPEEIWSAWAMDPLILLPLAGAAWLYARGVARLRTARRRRSVATRALAFYGGLLALAGALLSPLHAAAEALFSAHMVQHLALMLVAAPLLVLGAPLTRSWRGLPRRTQSSLATWHRAMAPWTRRLVHPLLVMALHAAALWTWHFPEVYGAGLADPALHALEHASFLGSALLFWTVVIRGGSQQRAPYAALAVVFLTALHSGALGALITFAARPLYDAHVGRAAAWGADALADQQLAGLVMSVPAGALYLVTMATLLLRWLRAMDGDPRPAALAEAGDAR